MSNSFLLEQFTTLLQIPLSCRTWVFIQGFLPLDRLPAMGNKPYLPAMSPWGGALTRPVGPGADNTGSLLHAVGLSLIRVPTCCLSVKDE
jgi:hypothetical protein